jgi:putative oxidoreductase
MTTTGTSPSSISALLNRSDPTYQLNGPMSGVALSAVRSIVSFLFACHGAKILLGVLGGIGQHGGSAPIGSWPIWWAGIIELVGGGLVLIGLFTRPAAVLCSGAMAFAYFTVHQPQGVLPLQNHGELAVLYCLIFLLIAILGPGRFAIETMLRATNPQPHDTASADQAGSVAGIRTPRSAGTD